MDKLLSFKDVCARYGISRTTLYNWLNKGDFPTPIQPDYSASKRWQLAGLRQYEECCRVSRSTRERKIAESAAHANKRELRELRELA